MVKKIICGEIDEATIKGTPIEVFKFAIELAKRDDFIVETNNPQLVEALEVLCGEKNIDFYISMNGELIKEESVVKIYNYLGDIYNIINQIRFIRDLEDDFDLEAKEEDILDDIREYEVAHQYCSEEKHPVDMSKFKDYEEDIEPKRLKAYKTDKTVVFSNRFGKKVVANEGDWIVQYPNGELSLYYGADFSKNYKEVKK